MGFGFEDDFVNYGVNLDSWTPFGSGPAVGFFGSPTVIGDRLGLFVNPSGPTLGLAASYESGDFFSGSSTFDGDFDSFGITPGLFVNRLDSGTAIDFIIINIIPEPDSVILIFLGCMNLVWRRR